MELDRSPVATSVVTRQEMETRNLYELDQALSTLEGVNSYRTKGPTDNDFGVGMRGFAGRGSGQSRTLILLDGQPLNNAYTGTVNWALLPISEFERVEVARGPFSSLYGGNAMGGVINLITRPIDHRILELFGQYGSYDTTNYSIHAADRFFNRLGISIGYQRLQTGGYQDQVVTQSASTGSTGTPVTGILPTLTSTGSPTFVVGRRGNGWFNQHAYRGRAEYTFSPKTFATLQYFHETRGQAFDAYTTNAMDAAGNPVYTGPVTFSSAGTARRLTLSPSTFIGTPAGAENNTYQAQIYTTFNSRWNLHVMAGFNHNPTDWYVTPGSDATLTSGSGGYADTVSRSWYGNVQAGWTPNRINQFIFGTETRQDRASVTTTIVSNYTVHQLDGPLQNFAQGQSVNQSGYVQDQITLSESLQVVVGGRYDYWRTYEGRNQPLATTPVINFPDRSAKAFTGKAAVSWQAGAGFVLRGSVGNSFRNPSIYELYRDLFLSSSKLLANPNAKPEYLTAFDFGVQRKLGKWTNIDVSYYENHIRDLLYRVTDYDTDPTGATRRLTNAGKGRTRGVELAASQRAFYWLQLKETYTYTNAIITENAGLPDTIGKHIPWVPNHMTSVVALLNHHRWFGSASGRYQSAMYSTDTNTDIVRGVPGSYGPFFLADLSAGYQFTKHLTGTVNVYNLLDRTYYLYNVALGRQAFVGLRIRL